VIEPIDLLGLSMPRSKLGASGVSLKTLRSVILGC
jgi:hypothetical protein